MSDRGPLLDRVGVTTSGDGEIVVVFGRCPGDPLTTLVIASLEEGEVGDRPVLWEIASSDPGVAQPTSFRVGETPPGFEEVVAYEKSLEAGEGGQAQVTSREYLSVGVSFRVSELRPGQVQVAGIGLVDREDFFRDARDACPER